jgi:hypothetical protein
MRFSRKLETVRAKTDVKVFASQITSIYADWLATRRGPSDQQPIFDPAVLLRAERLVRQLNDKGQVDRLLALLNTLVRNQATIERTIIVWVDLIDALVHTTEGRFNGHQRGELKAAEVKHVLWYLLRSSRLDIPNVPRPLQPLIVDVIASWTINSVVALTNDHALWGREHDYGHQSPYEIVLWLWHRFGQVTQPIWAPLAALADRIWVAVEFRAPLSPAIQAALHAIEADSLMVTERQVVSELVRLKISIAQNSDAIIAGVQLVGIAVDQTEKFASLPGPGKQQYARELVLEVLKELGFDTSNPLLSIAVEVIVNNTIDATVRLFNDRGHFASHAFATNQA